jgi:hypothetical protein
MAIIVEDGSGVVGANSYASVAELDAYAAHRLDLASYNTAQKESALVIASSDWMDGTHEFCGDQLTTTQGLFFPTVVDGLPANIKTATLKAALLQLQGLLLVDYKSISQSGVVESESKSLGSLSKSVTYKSGTSQIYGRILPTDLTNLLKPYLCATSSGPGVAYRV